MSKLDVESNVLESNEITIKEDGVMYNISDVYTVCFRKRDNWKIHIFENSDFEVIYIGEGNNNNET